MTTPSDSREVLTRAEDFAMPFDVSREPVRRRRDAPRAKHTPMLDGASVARGRQVFTDELAAAAAILTDVGEIDALVFLREPVARSTTAALVPEAADDARDEVAGLTLAWIDALAPVISARRPPRRWQPTRRRERRARTALVDVLRTLGADDPAAVATALAAGVQVPIAAGAWCLTLLASRPDLQHTEDRESLVVPFVWEVLRMYPPTWVLPRVTTRDVTIGPAAIPAYQPVLVSPLLLGRNPELVPGPDSGRSALDEFDPRRWLDASSRPGAWLPFGAGAHACPGRNLGIAQLTELVTWAAGYELDGTAPSVDASRGLSPTPSRIRIRTRNL